MTVCRRCRGSGREPDARAIGEKVRRLRRSRGAVVREVAQELGCSRTYISDLERGLRDWTGPVALRYLELVSRWEEERAIS